jgi:hypothetical protein
MKLSVVVNKETGEFIGIFESGKSAWVEGYQIIKTDSAVVDKLQKALAQFEIPTLTDSVSVTVAK